MESTTASPPHARALFKNMFQGSSLYMLAQVAPSVVSIILIPVVTKHLSQADYGVLDLLQQIGVVVSVLFGLKFSVALGYFYFETGADKSKVVGTALSGALLLGTLAGAMGWMAVELLSRVFFHSPDYTFCLRLMFLGLPLGFLLDSGLGWLRVENRAGLFTGISIFRLVLGAVGTMLLINLGFGIGGVVGSNVVAACVATIFIAAMALRFHGFTTSRVLLFRLLRFAVPSTLSGLALFAIHFSDRFILPLYRPLEDLGLYAVAYKLGMMLNPLQAAFESYWASQIYAIMRREDANLVLARSFTYLTLLMSFAGLGILFFAKPALQILTPPEYFPAIGLVPVILAAYYIRALGDFFRFIFLARGRPSREAACNGLTAAVSVSAYLLLIPRFGMHGAAWATLLTFIVSGVLSVVWSYRIWPYSLEGKRLVKIGVLTLLLVLAHFAVPPASILVEVLQRASLLLLFLVLLWAGRFASPGELEILYSLRSRITRSYGS